MSSSGKNFGLTVLFLFTVFISACGSSGSSPVADVTVSGTASDTTATASASDYNASVGGVGTLANATVKILNLSGTVVATGTTDSAGAYSINVPPSVDYIIRITKGNVSIKALLVSSSSSATVNVNPYSSAIVRSLADSMSKSNFGEAGTDVTGTIDASTLSTAITAILAHANFTALVTAIKNDIATNADYASTVATPSIGVASTNVTGNVSVTITAPTTNTGSTFQIQGSSWDIQTEDSTIDVSSAGWTLQFAQDGTYTNNRRDIVAAVDSAMAANCTMSGTYSAVTSTTLTVDITADSCWTPKQIKTNTGITWSVDDTVTPNVLTFAGFTANKQ